MKSAKITGDIGRELLDKTSPKEAAVESAEETPIPEPVTPETPKRITTVSQRGLDIIKHFEGFEAKPYLCPAGVWTIGYGNTYYENGVRVKKTDPAISKDRAESLLRIVVAGFEKEVDALTRDDISQGQFDALVSFTYNLGAHNYKNSQLAKKVNKNPNDPAIRKEFEKWVNSGAQKKVPGLVRRRNAEADLYFS